MWIAFFSIFAFATSFVEQPFPDSVRDAPNLARIKITNAGEARWSEDSSGMRRLYTYFEGSVEEPLKGTLKQGEVIEIRVIGGEKDGTRVSIPGVASFVANEDSVLMLSAQQADHSYDVFGLMMGKYVLKKDENGEEYIMGAGISPSDRISISRVKELIREQGNTPPADSAHLDQIDPSAPIQDPGGPPTSSQIVSEGPSDSSDERTSSTRGLPASTKIILGVAIGGLVWIFWRRRKSR